MGAEKRKPDFGGYATKAGVKCTDGRTIMPDAFKHQDKVTVPLVYQHGHTEIDNILGHVELHNREDGVYCYGYFNQTPQGKNSKELVAHGDLKSLSIFANKLIERGSQVIHGMIREVSLVLAGANPGATIDFVEIQHGDGSTTPLEDEAVISFGEELVHGDAVDAPAAQQSDGPTVKEVYDSMTPEQQDVVGFMVTEALKTSSTAAHSATGGEQQKDDKKSEDSQGESKKELAHNENGKDGAVKNNVFDQNGDKGNASKSVLSHDDLVSIVKHGQEIGSFKKAVEEHALKHGINDIELLFPDAKAVSSTPEFDSRRMEWVSSVLTGTKHSPFSRIKSLVADITHDQARAKGYIKGSMKKEEFFGLTKRTTGPTTIYKKQKLDRDDIIDITEMDVVMWLWGEMRLMLDEELARAILIGDGRAVDDEDKIKDPAGAQDGLGIRSILHDADLYAATINVNVDGTSSDGKPVRANTPAYLTTGTQANDATEAAAIHQLFGPRASEIPLSSTKALHGHSIGATGALEAMATILSLHHGKLPATVGVSQIDPAINLDVILNAPREVTPQLALSNSLAFGGLNAVLAIRPAPKHSGDNTPR